MQQTSCRPHRDAHNFKPPSPAVLSVSRDILNDKLANLGRDTPQHDAPSNDIPERPRTKISAISASSLTSPGPSILTGTDIITAPDSDRVGCEWGSWQPWTRCDAACGEEGERTRRRECPCESCSGGFTTEIEICQAPPCSFNPNNSKKNPFD